MNVFSLIVAMQCALAANAYHLNNHHHHHHHHHQHIPSQPTSSQAPTTTAVTSSTCSSRRDLFQYCIASAAPTLVLWGGGFGAVPSAVAVTGPTDGNLVDLPAEAVRSYLQYRIPLQTSADFYIFDLQSKLADPSDWGEIGELFQVNNNNGQGNPSRIEREFTNVMRVLGLSMPPDTADEMRDAQFKFERAMASIAKVTNGIRRDLPVEMDSKDIVIVKEQWDNGRKAINEFFVTLNEATGLNEMRVIPPPGPNQFQEYGRSEGRYVNLKKKIKLCQNRGGPTLSQGWGKLMVAGYMQDSCGIPDLEEYFYQ